MVAQEPATETDTDTYTDTDTGEEMGDGRYLNGGGAVIVVQVATLTFCVLCYEKCMTNGPKHAWPKKYA